MFTLHLSPLIVVLGIACPSYSFFGEPVSPTEQVFTKMYQGGAWEPNKANQPNPYPGSTMPNTVKYREFLQTFMKNHNIRSVVDVGCGDWEFSQHVDWNGIQYIGYDVVKSIVDADTEHFGTDSIKFIHSDGIATDLPEADLLVCKDVLQHLTNEQICQFIKQFPKFSYCLITNDVDPSTLTSVNSDTPIGGYRSVDLSQPPFSVSGEKVLAYEASGNTKQTFLCQKTSLKDQPYDLTLVGPISYGSLCRFLPEWVDNLSNDLRINAKVIDACCLSGFSPMVRTIVQNGYRKAGNVAVLLDITNYYQDVPKESKIKLIISAYEATKLPQEWVDIYNTAFDAIVVTDPWLIDVYTTSGVTKPIFCLPPGLDLKGHLQEPLRTAPHKPFVFGMSGAYWQRKNHEVLLKAFAEEFGSNPDVRLRLHGRGAEADGLLPGLKKYAEGHHLSNVEISCCLMSIPKFNEFLKSLDAYVLVSKGEGYSMSPREAMALGIPCVLSNNTAHTTICKTGLVRAVDSSIPVEIGEYYIKATDSGFRFNCSVEDVRAALRDVYEHYNMYLDKTKQAREWVRQYQFEELKPLYLTLVKPKKVVLGKENKLEAGCLTTNSKDLYEKYLSIISDK